MELSLIGRRLGIHCSTYTQIIRSNEFHEDEKTRKNYRVIPKKVLFGIFRVILVSKEKKNFSFLAFFPHVYGKPF